MGLNNHLRLGFDRSTKAVKWFGYTQCLADHTMFIKHLEACRRAILIVYVDDILTGDHHKELLRLKNFLVKEFEIKDLGNLKYFLRMVIAGSQRIISVSQRKYVVHLLKETGMIGCKPVDTPIDTSAKFGAQPSGCPVDKGRYQRLGSLFIYLTLNRL